MCSYVKQVLKKRFPLPQPPLKPSIASPTTPTEPSKFNVLPWPRSLRKARPFSPALAPPENRYLSQPPGPEQYTGSSRGGGFGHPLQKFMERFPVFVINVMPQCPPGIGSIYQPWQHLPTVAAFTNRGSIYQPRQHSPTVAAFTNRGSICRRGVGWSSRPQSSLAVLRLRFTSRHRKS